MKHSLKNSIFWPTYRVTTPSPYIVGKISLVPLIFVKSACLAGVLVFDDDVLDPPVHVQAVGGQGPEQQQDSGLQKIPDLSPLDSWLLVGHFPIGF